jgi:hypothetical protein
MEAITDVGSTSPMDAALKGMETAGANMQDAAEEVLTVTTQSPGNENVSSNHSEIGITDVVRLSDAARNIQDGTLSLESGLTGTQSGSVTYSANAAVVKSAQDQVANMIDMVIAGSQITR